MFKVGDLVKITSKADIKWIRWQDSIDTYKYFISEIGVIEDSNIDEDRTNTEIYRVTVEFPNGLGQLIAGLYYEWFRPEHLSRTSQYEKDIFIHKKQMAVELQEWEAFKKKSTNDTLKTIFGLETDNKVDNKKNDELDEMTTSEWDLKTEPDYFNGLQHI